MGQRIIKEMTEMIEEQEQRVPSGWRQLLAFGLQCLLWLIGLVVATAVILHAGSGVDADPSAGLTLGISAVTTLGFLALASRLADRGALVRRQVFAWKARPLPLVFSAVLAGFSLELFAGWWSELLVGLSEVFSTEHLEEMADMLVDGSSADRAMGMALVLLVAPFAEELIFRGFVWDCLEREWGRNAAWLLSSFAFALYHFDPLHVVSVLPLSLLLGALRLRTGSIVPAIAAHFGNNLLAVVFLWKFGADEAMAVPSDVALIGLIVSLVILVAGCSFQSQPESARE
jgi:hypothetical protein